MISAISLLVPVHMLHVCMLYIRREHVYVRMNGKQKAQSGRAAKRPVLGGGMDFFVHEVVLCIYLIEYPFACCTCHQKDVYNTYQPHSIRLGHNSTDCGSQPSEERYEDDVNVAWLVTHTA